METVKKQRDYLYDNYKAFLIFLVVIGHFIEPAYTNHEFLYTLKWFIFAFHMPAFIFISGYFSKRELPFKDLVCKLAVPYLVYEVIYYLLYTVFLHKPATLDLLCPKFSLWYILCPVCMAGGNSLCEEDPAPHDPGHPRRPSDRLFRDEG